MSGTGGVVLLDGGSPDAAGMQRMVDALRHRGPDDEGFWVQAGLGMAHTRLSVIDLSPAGRQPMHVESPRLCSPKYLSHTRRVRSEVVLLAPEADGDTRDESHGR